MLLGIVRSDSNMLDYHVTWNGRQIQCDCPSFKFGPWDQNGHCKHLRKWFGSDEAKALLNALQEVK